MIIDFRMRPPAKGFDKMGGLYGPNGNVHAYPCNGPDAWPVPSADHFSMSEFFKEMEESGISKGCVLGRNASTGWSGVDNADIYSLCAEHPDKFIGFGGMDAAADIMESVALVEKCKKDYGFRGMVCEPGNARPAYRPDDRRMYPFYARCVELDMIVVISLSHFLVPNVSYCDPSHMQNVCQDFPRGKFVIAHAAFPHINAAIAAAISEKNLWLIPDAYLSMTQAPGRDLWRQGIHYLQGRRMLFGTAYPFRGLPQSVAETQKLDLPERYYAMYMYQNALEILEM